MSTGVDAQTCKLIVLDQRIQSMTEFKQNVPTAPSFGARYSNPLAVNLLAMTIPDKPTSRNHWHRTTDKGCALRVTPPTEKTE